MHATSVKKLSLLKPNVNAVIEGRSIFLAPISEGDINGRYLSWLNDKETNQFLETRHRKQTEEDIFRYINTLRSQEGCELFGIYMKKSREHVGNISIVSFNVNNQGNASYGILVGDKKALIFGLGAEATLLLVEYLFRDPRIRRVHGGIIAKNTKGWKAVEAAGFKREGVLRESAVLGAGELSDVYVYGLLRREWEEKKSQFAPILKSVAINPCHQK